MKKDLTDITVVMDRSGSMSRCKADAEGGLNQFVADQKKQPGHATFTLVQFDHEYEFVHRAVPIADVPQYTLVPRGNTALLDAVGRAVTEAGERIGKMPEADRPGLVVFVIVTDGEENASREYGREKIREMIEHQQNVYKWQFTFLAANMDAFTAARNMAIPTSAAANFTSKTAGKVYKAASDNVVRMRCAVAEGTTPTNAYSEKEILAMAGKDEK